MKFYSQVNEPELTQLGVMAILTTKDKNIKPRFLTSRLILTKKNGMRRASINLNNSEILY